MSVACFGSSSPIFFYRFCQKGVRSGIKLNLVTVNTDTRIHTESGSSQNQNLTPGAVSR